MSELKWVSLAFVQVAKLCEALGVEAINRLPGCWEHQVDDNWFIAANGHREPTKCTKGITVQPFHCYVEWNGFPAGEFHPIEGGFIAMGQLANEDTFIEALQRATEKANASV